ncbi:MAG: hypothetical protein KDC32_08285, partial [Saprospiraceae bacterium]|nr:hypothetical protein [Saprospiraceae bacterium]
KRRTRVIVVLIWVESSRTIAVFDNFPALSFCEVYRPSSSRTTAPVKNTFEYPTIHRQNSRKMTRQFAAVLAILEK